jgi:hypothetical protein
MNANFPKWGKNLTSYDPMNPKTEIEPRISRMDTDYERVILESAIGVSFFTAEAQRSQRNAEPCMWEDRKFGKTMELLCSTNG